MPKRQYNRNDLRVMTRRQCYWISDQLAHDIFSVQFLDEKLQEAGRPGECGRAPCEFLEESYAPRDSPGENPLTVHVRPVRLSSVSSGTAG